MKARKALDRSRKFVKTTIYITRLFTRQRNTGKVAYKSQTKARQALVKSRKSIKTTTYKYRVVYMAQTKAIKALDRSRRHQQKIKNLHSIFIQKEV